MIDDDEEDKSIRDALLREKMEDLGLDNFSNMKNYGKGTGLNPNPTEYQIKCIEKLASKIHISKSKAKQKDDEEEGIAFDLLSEPRVILYEGKVFKKTRNSLVSNSSKRLLILLNDVILICSIQSSSGILNTSEKYSIHQIINLNECSTTNLSNRSDQDEKHHSFEITTPDRCYTIITENEEDKLLWLDELEKAIFAIVTEEADKYHIIPKEGWQHTILRGTIHSDAYYGRFDNLQTHIKKLELEGKSLNIKDDSGNYPLHWASLQGHKECVELLINSGSEIDILNNSLNSPLLLASAGGHYAIVNYLIEQGSNFFLRNLKDRDALCLAVLYGSHSNDLYNILNCLKFNDVNVNQFDSSGSTCLHECAARSKGSRPVQILVDLGAEVNIRHMRNGLTPLQMSCSTIRSDAETVRSFLDKGAHPNWKDAAGRSAFDLIIYSHNLTSTKIVPQEEAHDPYNQPKTMSVDEMTYFVQYGLPALMEIVKRGGRYTERSLSRLRPSFKEAINSARLHWIQQEEPVDFLEYVHNIFNGNVAIAKNKWSKDSSSKICMVCVEKFSFSNRKHHCRACGILCCAICSSKRLTLNINDVIASPPSTPPSGSNSPPISPPTIEKPSNPNGRVCDGCFNKLVFESWNKQQEQKVKDKEDKLKEEEENKRNIANRDRKNSSWFSNKSSLIGNDDVNSEKDNIKKSDSGSNIASTNNVNKGVSNVAGAINEALIALNERGEKISNVLDKSNELKDAANDYNKMAAKLLKQQQKQNWHGIY